MFPTLNRIKAIYMFNVDSLILEQIILEVRFQHGYLYWDNCGKIWNDIFKKYPDVEAESITAESASFIMKDSEIGLKFSRGHINISQQYPENLKLFSEFSDSTINIITGYLNIDTFTRVGNRFFYTLKVNDSSEAMDLLKNAGFMNCSDEKIKEIGDHIKEPSVKFVITKSDDIGHTFNFRYLDRKLELKIPRPVKFDTSQFINKVLSLDVDFYTQKPVDLAILNAKDLTKNNKRNIEKYFKIFFQ